MFDDEETSTISIKHNLASKKSFSQAAIRLPYLLDFRLGIMQNILHKATFN